MVKHTITNNQCYVLVSIEGFLSRRQSSRKNLLQNIGGKQQQETTSHQNYGEG